MVADPREYRLTFRDYLALPEDEDREREIIRGRLYVTAKPAADHQWLMLDLCDVLRDRVRRSGGNRRQVLPDADLIMNEIGSYVSPDIMYFEAAELARLLALPARRRRRFINVQHVRPTLVVELVSPDTAARDVIEKLQDYEAVGIPHYWVFGPEPRRFRELVLDAASGRYRLVVDAVGGRVVPTLFAAEPVLTIDLDALTE